MFKLIKKIWNTESQNVTAAALLVGSASLASRLVGLLRDRLLASSFGAGDALDAYYAAFRLPEFFYQLIVLGAVTAGFIPVFIEYLNRKSDAEARKLAELVFSTLTITLIVICGIMAAFADYLVPLTVPGFAGAKLAETVFLSRILLISTVLLGMSAVMGGILQSLRRFVAFSFAPVLYNFGIIAGIFFLAPSMGIAGVAWGVAIGAFLHFAVQAVVAMPLGLQKLRWPSFTDQGVRRIFYLTIPRAGALAASQINLIILIALASSLDKGSITVFNLANNLQYVPIGLIGISFAVASLPIFSDLVAANNLDGLRKEFLAVTRKVFFLIIPATALILLLRAQIVRILYGAGEFDWTATIRTADVLAMFALSLIAQSAAPVITRVFYALKDSKTPFIIAIISMAVNIIIAFLLKDSYGVAGLAAAFSIGSFMQFGLLWYLLRKRLGGHLDGKELSISLSKTILASLALFGFGWLARQYIGTVYPLRTFMQVALQAGAACVLGITAFCVLASLLRVQEFAEFVAAMKSKLLRKAKIGEGADQARGV
ncbi:MAG: murein biosynthesis integral membrane protein MurJ [Patescibacteria group bacterium]